MNRPIALRWGVPLLAGALLLSLVPSAFATHEDEATLTIRHEPDPDDACDALVIEVDDVDNATIRLGIFQSGEGSAPDTELVSEEPVGTPDVGSGLFDYTLGPYSREDLDGRTFDLYVGVAWGEPGEHRIISDHFDLRCDEDDAPPTTPPSPAQPPVCTDSLSAEALDDGSVRLSWDAVVENEGELDHYRVLRVESADDDGLGGGETIAEVQGTAYVDTTAEAGVSYRYSVHAVGEAFTSCGSVEVTAVPFFGAPVLLALAGAGGLGAYALARRRS